MDPDLASKFKVVDALEKSGVAVRKAVQTLWLLQKASSVDDSTASKIGALTEHLQAALPALRALFGEAQLRLSKAQELSASRKAAE